MRAMRQQIQHGNIQAIKLAKPSQRQLDSVGQRRITLVSSSFLIYWDIVAHPLKGLTLATPPTSPPPPTYPGCD